MTLTDFLLARITEDEVRATLREWHDRDCDTIPDASGYSYPCDCGVPERMAAECEVKRRIVEELVRVGDKIAAANRMAIPPLIAREFGLETAAKALTLPYSDHPDYRDEWRP